MEEQVKSLIPLLRKNKYAKDLWVEFRDLIKDHLEEICRDLDTRWLVSVCDTYVDCGDEIYSRNAMMVVQLVNFEKLWATYLLMHDVKENQDKIQQLKKNKVIPLWDGMYSFNINHGDMTNNLFYRIETLMKATPEIEAIYREVKNRIEKRGTVLSRLNEYHGKLFEPYPRRSLIRIMRKKLRMVFKTYKA
jgi:hypothetical protein